MCVFINPFLLDTIPQTQKDEINNDQKATLPVVSYQEARDAPTEPINTKRAGAKIQTAQSDRQSPSPSFELRNKYVLCFIFERGPPPQQSGPLCLVICPPHTHARARTHTGQAALAVLKGKERVAAPVSVSYVITTARMLCTPQRLSQNHCFYLHVMVIPKYGSQN